MSLLSLSRSLCFSFPTSKPNKNPPPFSPSSSLPSPLSFLNLQTFPSSSSSNLAASFNSNPKDPLLPAAWQQPIYTYPDPIPEFAIAETDKFRDELRKKLSNSKEAFGDDIDAIVEVCAEILSEFLHKEYGGPGTLVVEPFTDMLLAVKERGLPGAAVAARAALLWAQNYLDKDWEIWTSEKP